MRGIQTTFDLIKHLIAWASALAKRALFTGVTRCQTEIMAVAIVRDRLHMARNQQLAGVTETELFAASLSGRSDHSYLMSLQLHLVTQGNEKLFSA